MHPPASSPAPRGYLGGSIKDRLRKDGWNVVDLILEIRMPKPRAAAGPSPFRVWERIFHRNNCVVRSAIVHCAYDFFPAQLGNENLRGQCAYMQWLLRLPARLARRQSCVSISRHERVSRVAAFALWPGQAGSGTKVFPPGDVFAHAPGIDLWRPNPQGIVGINLVKQAKDTSRSCRSSAMAHRPCIQLIQEDLCQVIFDHVS